MKVFALKGTNDKAIVVQSEGLSKLSSYDTEVAVYDHTNNKMTVNGWYSQTTMKHLNKFFEYYGFDCCTKQELIKHYNLTENI